MTHKNYDDMQEPNSRESIYLYIYLPSIFGRQKKRIQFFFYFHHFIFFSYYEVFTLYETVRKYKCITDRKEV